MPLPSEKRKLELRIKKEVPEWVKIPLLVRQKILNVVFKKEEVVRVDLKPVVPILGFGEKK